MLYSEEAVIAMMAGKAYLRSSEPTEASPNSKGAVFVTVLAICLTSNSETV